MGDAEHVCAVQDLTAPDGDTAPAPTSLFAPAVRVASADAVPRLIKPISLAAGTPPTMRATTLGPRLPFTGTADMAALGEAVHGFFAADRPDAEQALREVIAERLLRAWGVAALSPSDVVRAADRLWIWLRATWPSCTWRAEVPVFQRIGMQRLSGRVDLVVEHAEGLVVLDHKTFPGRLDDWASRAAAHQPQLRAYAGALESATGRPVTGLVLHLPVAGVVHEFLAP